MRFPLPPLADDALLLLWRVAAMPLDALEVCRAWGFVPKSEIVWVKTPAHTDAENPRLAFGMGHYVRAAHEVCIVATRGRFKVADRSVRSVFLAPRGRHSAKPEEFYALAQRLGGEGPYAELFARTPRPGWLQVGDELPAEVSP
jgi:N6-adenosine-specific RNA methylase IME4